MEHNLERVPLDALISLQEIVAAGRADTAALIARYGSERQRARRLIEYGEKIFAEIRAS